MSSFADVVKSGLSVDEPFDSIDGLRLSCLSLPEKDSVLSILIQHRITFSSERGRTRANFLAQFKKTFPAGVFAADVNELWTSIHKTDSIFNLGVIAQYCNFVEQHGFVTEFHRLEIQNSIVPLK
jgi:hypothetical protein